MFISSFMGCGFYSASYFFLKGAIMGLTELSDYIPKLIESCGRFLSTGIMFYIVSILVFAVVVDTFINLTRRR